MTGEHRGGDGAVRRMGFRIGAEGRASLTALVRLALPVVVARLGIQIMGLTDAVVVGRYSAQQLGYHALGWAPTMVVLVSAIGLLNGVQVMTARHVGSGQPDLAGAVLRRGLVYALWLGIGSTALMWFGGPWFLAHIGLDTDLAQGAGRALRVFSLSMVPYLLFVAATNFVEGLGRPLSGTVIMWIANAVNLGLNLLFVPGTLGLPAMGAVGAGWATFGSRTLMAALLIGWIFSRPEARSLGLFHRPVRDRAAEREQRRIGYGAGASLFVEVGAFSGMNIVAGWLGAQAVASWAVVLNVTAIVFMFPMGVAAATAVLVGQAFGAKDHPGLVRSALSGFGLATVIALVFWLAVGFGAREIAHGYIQDEALVRMTSGALVLAALFFVPDALQVVAANALRARGDVLVPTITHTVSYAVIMLPLGWAMAHPLHMGLSGILWSVVIASFISAGLLLWRFQRLTARGDA